MALELELRYLASDLSSIRVRLLGSAAKKLATVRISDCWYAPDSVVDLVSHDAWLASGNARPIRVREIVGQERQVLLEVKRIVDLRSSAVSDETALTVFDADDAHAFARALGYTRLASLTKMREIWSDGAYCVHLDEYEGHGSVIEIEHEDIEGEDFDLVGLREYASLLVTQDATELDFPTAPTFVRRVLSTPGSSTEDA